ncbi:transcriptional regulator [Bacillus sp. VT-16-64]|nr:transcriptional regulator [Bacillus sp. VT-16-64]
MKIERLFGITVLLIHRKRMKAAELSRYFEVSERTIYRDINSLSRAGIPILSLPGQEGGYELMEGFRLDKKYLTLDDLLSIQWALKSIENATGLKDIESLLAKVNQLIDPESIQDHCVHFQISQSSDLTQHHIQVIYHSIQHSRVIGMRYVDYNGNETERYIEPMAIFFKDYNWYTWAYCLLRHELRVFKLTRIIETHNTDRYFTRRPYTMEDINAKKNEKSENNAIPFTVRLQFSQEARAQVLDNFKEDEIMNHPDGTISVTKEYYTIDQALTQIISYRNKVRILHPKELIHKFINCLDDMKNIYKE